LIFNDENLPGPMERKQPCLGAKHPQRSVEALWGNMGKPAIPSWRKPEVSAKQTSAESAPTEN